jgi:hypothetical protein|nr:hypothetical protein [Kofleriaceae bacterium]
MRTWLAAIASVLAACGGSGGGRGAGDAAGARDGASVDTASGGDAARDAGSGSAAPIPTYPDSPTQTLTAPAGADPSGGWGIISALSADGLTLATFDRTHLYIYDRASGSAAFDASPTQTVTVPSVFDVGTGLTLTSDGSLLAVGGIANNTGALELLVFARDAAGSGFAATPQAIAAVSSYSEVGVAALTPGGDELATEGSGDDIIVLSRTAGSAFAPAPSQTIAPPAGASDFFPALASFAGDGTLAVSDLGGGSGIGAIDVYSPAAAGSSTLDATPIAIVAPAGMHAFADGVALRADGAELVESSNSPGHALIFANHAGSWVAGQMIAPPTGANSSFGVSVTVAGDGTLAVDDGGDIYIYEPTGR